MHLNDVPWGFLWFAFIIVVWIFQGLAKLAKSAQRQTTNAQTKAAAARPQPIADRVAAASASASAAATANVRQISPSRPAAPAPPPRPPHSSVRIAPGRAVVGLPKAAHHETVHIRHPGQLLAPFTHPNRLLASIVVAEALRPPLGLRPFDQR